MASSPLHTQQIQENEGFCESNVFEDLVEYDKVKAAWEGLEDEVRAQDQGKAKEQFKILYTAAGINSLLDEEFMRPVEMGGGAILTYLVNEDGYQALENWRGTGDSDKQLMAEGEFGSRRGIERAIENSLGSINARGNDLITESLNMYHEGEKYTVRASPTGDPDDIVEVDVQRPDEQVDELFNYDRTREVELAGCSIRVPHEEDLFFSKLEAFEDNDRDKDISDMANILYVVEQRNERGEINTDYERLKRISEEKSLEETYEEAMDEIGYRLPQIKSGTGYTPSKDFLGLN